MIWLHESHYAVYNLLSAFECRTGEGDEVSLSLYGRVKTFFRYTNSPKLIDFEFIERKVILGRLGLITGTPQMRVWK